VSTVREGQALCGRRAFQGRESRRGSLADAGAQVAPAINLAQNFIGRVGSDRSGPFLERIEDCSGHRGGIGEQVLHARCAFFENAVIEGAHTHAALNAAVSSPSSTLHRNRSSTHQLCRRPPHGTGEPVNCRSTRMDQDLKKALQHLQRLPLRTQQKCAEVINRFIEHSYRMSATNDGDEGASMDEIIKRVGEPRMADVKGD
jgi:hypothetical protein